MPGAGRVGGLRIPSLHCKLGVSTPNHEPVNGITGHESTDSTSEFLQRCHVFSSVYQLLIALTSRERLDAELAAAPLNRRLTPPLPHPEGGQPGPTFLARERFRL